MEATMANDLLQHLDAAVDSVKGGVIVARVPATWTRERNKEEYARLGEDGARVFMIPTSELADGDAAETTGATGRLLYAMKLTEALRAGVRAVATATV